MGGLVCVLPLFSGLGSNVASLGLLNATSAFIWASSVKWRKDHEDVGCGRVMSLGHLW